MDIKKIGTKIKTRRIALGMTQKDLAQAIKISNQLVSKWETGESVPSLEYIDSLCSALQVDVTYFLKDGEAEPDGGETEEPQAEERRFECVSDKPRKRIKINAKALVISLCGSAAALLIVGITLLTYYVFVPAASKTRYLEEIDTALINYFELGYYSVNVTGYLDGDEEKNDTYKGYIDENGSAVFENDYYVVADGVITDKSDYRDSYKYHYIQPESIKTLEDLVKTEVFEDLDDGDLVTDEDITYIRRTSYGFYIECKEELLTEDMSGSEKKNIKFTDKIRGEVKIENGIFRSIGFTAKFEKAPEGERFTVESRIEFTAEKPRIAHKELEKRVWNYGVPSKYVAKSDDLVTMSELMSKVSARAQKAGTPDSRLEEEIREGKLRYEDGSLYVVRDGSMVFLDPVTFAVKRTLELTGFREWDSDVNLYGGCVYYRSSERNRMVCLNVNSGVESIMEDVDLNDISHPKFHRKYCWDAYGSNFVYDLKSRSAVFVDDCSQIYYVDNSGRIYYRDSSQALVCRDGETKTTLKGDDFYMDDVNLLVDGNTVYTRDRKNGYNGYCYKYGKLVMELPIIYGDRYSEIPGGYIENDLSDGFVYNCDGSVRDVLSNIELWNGGYTDNEKNYNYIFPWLGDAGTYDDKILVRNDSMLIVYKANDVSKPMCYAKCDADDSSFKVYKINSFTIICVGTEYWVIV